MITALFALALAFAALILSAMTFFASRRPAADVEGRSGTACRPIEALEPIQAQVDDRQAMPASHAEAAPVEVIESPPIAMSLPPRKPEAPEQFAELLQDCGFDAEQYLGNNPDLAQGGLPAQSAMSHFVQFGFFEGRHIHLSCSFDQLSDVIDRHPYPDNTGIGKYSMPLALLWSWLCSLSQEQIWQQDFSEAFRYLHTSDATPFIVIGDSHSWSYSRIFSGRYGAFAPIHLLCSGGSAMGLHNKDSKSGYGERLVNLISGPFGQRAAVSNVTIWLKFGQVDTEFVSVFRRIKSHNNNFDFTDFEIFARESVDKYSQFLEELISTFPQKHLLRICSIYPPVLSDDVWQHGYVNAHIGYLESDLQLAELEYAVRNLEIPNLAMRTRMHALYNGLLQTMCARLGLAFVDDFMPLLSAEGTIDMRYVGGADRIDHHIPLPALRDLIQANVEKFARALPRGA